jgi:hypothetical protein
MKVRMTTIICSMVFFSLQSTIPFAQPKELASEPHGMGFLMLRLVEQAKCELRDAIQDAVGKDKTNAQTPGRKRQLQWFDSMSGKTSLKLVFGQSGRTERVENSFAVADYLPTQNERFRCISRDGDDSLKINDWLDNATFIYLLPVDALGVPPLPPALTHEVTFTIGSSGALVTSSATFY